MTIIFYICFFVLISTLYITAYCMWSALSEIQASLKELEGLQRQVDFLSELNIKLMKI